MKNKNIVKLLIILMTASLGVAKTYAYAEVEQSLRTVVQPAVSITKNAGSSTESTTANALTGTIGTLVTVFDLRNNGSDDDYDFIMSSSLVSDSGKVSAYGNDGCLLFGNIVNEPTEADINNAKIGGDNNRNVIAYPVTIGITNPMTSEFTAGHATYGDCYVIKVNNETDGVVTHTIGTNPISGTYRVGQDTAGTYQAVVTLTAISK